MSLSQALNQFAQNLGRYLVVGIVGLVLTISVIIDFLNTGMVASFSRSSAR